MLEIVIAMAILALAVVLFGSAMISTTDAEAKAAEHTQAIMIGNYLLEDARTDPHFWEDEFTGGPSCVAPANCWTAMDPSNVDSNGNVLPPYDDALSTAPSPATWHLGFLPPQAGSVTLPTYYYMWRADPIDPASFTGVKKEVSSVTIELYVAQDGPQDVYVVHGMNREQ